MDELAGFGFIGDEVRVPQGHPAVLEKGDAAAVIVLECLFGWIADEIPFDDRLIHFVGTPRPFDCGVPWSVCCVDSGTQSCVPFCLLFPFSQFTDFKASTALVGWPTTRLGVRVSAKANTHKCQTNADQNEATRFRNGTNLTYDGITPEADSPVRVLNPS